MDKNRLEAFSDGVLAIIITIMVLELKVPHATTFEALQPLLPVFVSYVLSFLYVGIYWANHHHLIKSARRLTAGIMWANLHLLFWLSLIPFASSWAGQNHLASLPVALYGVILLLSAIAYYILQSLVIADHGPESALTKAMGLDYKGKLSPMIYAIAIPVAFYRPWISSGLYMLVALIWLVPDQRLERSIEGNGHSH